MAFIIEVLLDGLATGALYGLVALGFILIYKASGIFNFAQGMMVYFNALAFVYFLNWFQSFNISINHIWTIILALLMTSLVILVYSWLFVRFVFKYLINQTEATLLMATLGIAYILEGFAQVIFGAGARFIHLNLPADSVVVGENLFQGGILVNYEDWLGVLFVTLIVILFTLFFKFSQLGRALRAVADDHQAAQSVGIPLIRIWIIVWFIGGLTALFAGILWGNKLTVEYSISTLALRVLPVVVIGGLTSIAGAIVGGLIVGVGEILTEVYIGPLIGGAIDIWFAYVVALFVLLVRPQGLFGERIIDRV